MNRNLSDLEQRLLAILREDSRKSISDIAVELDISRTTAKKAMDSLLDSGRIRAFTVQMNDDEKDLVLLHIDDPGPVPNRYILEDFELIDGTHIVVIHYENLVKLDGLRIIDVKIAKRKLGGESPGRAMHIHCDLCGNDIHNEPILVKTKGKTYYACCPGCESTLRKRVPLIEEH